MAGRSSRGFGETLTDFTFQLWKPNIRSEFPAQMSVLCNLTLQIDVSKLLDWYYDDRILHA